MRKFRIIAATLLAAAAFYLINAAIQPDDWEKATESAAINSVFRIQTTFTTNDGAGNFESGHGTGFLISAQGHILTAQHVLTDDRYLAAPDKFTRSVHIYLRQGARDSVRAIIIKEDEKTDLAILQLDTAVNSLRIGKPQLLAADPHAKLGDALLALGYPGDDTLVPMSGKIRSTNASGL